MKFKEILLICSLVLVSGCDNLEFMNNSKIAPQTIQVEQNSHNIDEFTPLAKEIDSTIPNDDTCYNILPIRISEKYNVDVFQFNKSNKIYFYYNDKITNTNSMLDGNENECITGLVIADVNDDSYIEIYLAYQFGNNSTMSEVICFDTKSNVAIDSSTCYNGYLFFKIENENINVYKSLFNNIEEAKTLFINILPRNIYFTFSQDSYNLSCSSFSAEITLDTSCVNFPISLGGEYYFYANVKTNYFGETYSYMGSSTIYGAIPIFINQGEKDTYITESLLYNDDYGLQTIVEGTVFEDKITYFINDNINIGNYDMIVSYHNETITIENTLTIDHIS